LQQNMSGYSCGAIKLTSGPSGRIKLADFLDWILVYGPLKHIHGPQVKNLCHRGSLRKLKAQLLIRYIGHGYLITEERFQ